VHCMRTEAEERFGKIRISYTHVTTRSTTSGHHHRSFLKPSCAADRISSIFARCESTFFATPASNLLEASLNWSEIWC